MAFLSRFSAKYYNSLKKRVAPAMLAGIALLFATQMAKAQDDQGQNDDDGRNVTAITDCGTVITHSGRYFLANDLKMCPDVGISITVSDVRIELRGHTIQLPLPVAPNSGPNAIDANGGTTGLSNLEIEGAGTIVGGNSGINFGNVHRSRVYKVVVVGSNVGMTVNSGDFTNSTTAAATVSTENEISDNVFTGAPQHGISVNGGNQNRFINNNLSGNAFDGLLLFAGSNNVVRHNTADVNSVAGIEVGTAGSGNRVEDNIALGNNPDLLDDNGDCTHNNWMNNSFSSNIPPCIL